MAAPAILGSFAPPFEKKERMLMVVHMDRPPPYQEAAQDARL
jgi:hypothetical protein